MKQPKEVVEKWIKTCLEDGKGINAWENEFLVSVSEQLERKGTLSDRQEEIIERIYADKTE
jgi:hypothetical protein